MTIENRSQARNFGKKKKEKKKERKKEKECLARQRTSQGPRNWSIIRKNGFPRRAHRAGGHVVTPNICHFRTLRFQPTRTSFRKGVYTSGTRDVLHKNNSLNPGKAYCLVGVTPFRRDFVVEQWTTKPFFPSRGDSFCHLYFFQWYKPSISARHRAKPYRAKTSVVVARRMEVSGRRKIRSQKRQIRVTSSSRPVLQVNPLRS